MIIGITGTIAAGKGTIVEYLEKLGFTHYSVRKFLIKLIEERNLPVNRDSMVLVANELREKYSPSYIIEKLYLDAKENGGDVIIESIRTVGEVNSLREKKDFYLFSVEANQGVRYSRAMERNSETDNIDFEIFKKNEERELSNTDPNKQNLNGCIELADFKFTNNGTFNELYKKINTTMDSIKNKSDEEVKEEQYIRPTWDEYFMEVVSSISKRATCNRGRSGCVIAKDKQLIVTGYVGSPKGLPHCDEVGHQFKKMIHEDGHETTHCVRTVHAEQNAICQAAKSGASINGATLYCKMTPCRVCAMLIINCGVKRVVCEKKYQAGAESEKMFEESGVELEILNNEVEKY